MSDITLSVGFDADRASAQAMGESVKRQLSNQGIASGDGFVDNFTNAIQRGDAKVAASFNKWNKAFQDVEKEATNASRAIEAFGRDSDEASRAAARLEAAQHRAGIAARSFRTSVSNSTEEVRRHSDAMNSATRAVSEFGDVVKGVGMGVLISQFQNMTGVVVSAAGAIAELPAVMGAAGGAALTLKLGLTGVGDALKDMNDAGKFADDLQKLSPAAREFAESIKSIQPLLHGIQQATQESLFDGLGPMFAKLTGQSGGFLSTVQQMTTGIAAGLNESFKGVFDTITQGPGLAQFQGFVNNLTTAFDELAPAFAPFTEAFLGLMNTGSSFLPGFAKNVADIAQKFDNWVKSAQGSGQLQNMLQSAFDTLSQIGRIVGNVVEAFVKWGASSDFQGLLDSLEKISGFLKEHPGLITTAVEAFALFKGAQALGAVNNLSKALGMGDGVLGQLTKIKGFGPISIAVTLAVGAVMNQRSISDQVFDTFIGGVKKLPPGPIRDGLLRDNHIDPNYQGPLSPSDQARANQGTSAVPGGPPPGSDAVQGPGGRWYSGGGGTFDRDPSVGGGAPKGPEVTPSAPPAEGDWQPTQAQIDRARSGLPDIDSQGIGHQQIISGTASESERALIESHNRLVEVQERVYQTQLKLQDPKLVQGTQEWINAQKEASKASEDYAQAQQDATKAARDARNQAVEDLSGTSQARDFASRGLSTSDQFQEGQSEATTQLQGLGDTLRDARLKVAQDEAKGYNDPNSPNFSQYQNDKNALRKAQAAYNKGPSATGGDSSDPYALKLDSDLGLSKGLGGLVENLIKGIGMAFFEPLKEALKQTGLTDGSGRYGLTGLISVLRGDEAKKTDNPAEATQDLQSFLESGQLRVNIANIGSGSGSAGSGGSGSGIPLVQNPDGTWTSSDPEWAKLIARESGGIPNRVQGIQDANSGGNEASGLFQIARGTWASYGGTQYAPTAGEATPAQQAEIAAKIFNAEGVGPWGGRENEAALRAGLVGSSGQPVPTGGLTLGAPGSYGLKPGTDTGGYGSSGPSFPQWVHDIEQKFGVKASTYAGHQESDRSNEPGYAPNPQGLNRGIDWTGTPEQMKAFSAWLVQNQGQIPGLEQVIHASGDQRWGLGGHGNVLAAGGPDSNPYYNNAEGYEAHRNHVHTRFSSGFDVNGNPVLPSVPDGTSGLSAYGGTSYGSASISIGSATISVAGGGVAPGAAPAGPAPAPTPGPTPAPNPGAAPQIGPFPVPAGVGTPPSPAPAPAGPAPAPAGPTPTPSGLGPAQLAPPTSPQDILNGYTGGGGQGLILPTPGAHPQSGSLGGQPDTAVNSGGVSATGGGALGAPAAFGTGGLAGLASLGIQTGIQEGQRAVQYASQAGGIAVNGLLETIGFSDSKLAKNGWLQRIAGAVGGAAAAGANAAGSGLGDIVKKKLTPPNPNDPNKNQQGRGDQAKGGDTNINIHGTDTNNAQGVANTVARNQTAIQEGPMR